MYHQTVITNGTYVPDGVRGEEELIGFIGPRYGLSESLARSICSDLDAVGIARFSDFQQFFDNPVHAGQSLRVVLVDEHLAPEALRLKLVERESLKRIAVALAYRDLALVKRLYPALSGDGLIRSFVPMDTCLDLWLSVMRVITNGGIYVPPGLLAWAQSQESGDTRETGGAVSERLTRREREVLGLVARGGQNKHIAERLGLSEHTVKLHIHHIIRKLGVRNRTAAAARYFECPRA